MCHFSASQILSLSLISINHFQNDKLLAIITDEKSDHNINCDCSAAYQILTISHDCTVWQVKLVMPNNYILAQAIGWTRLVKLVSLAGLFLSMEYFHLAGIFFIFMIFFRFILNFPKHHKNLFFWILFPPYAYPSTL